MVRTDGQLVPVGTSDMGSQSAALPFPLAVSTCGSLSVSHACLRVYDSIVPIFREMHAEGTLDVFGILDDLSSWLV